MRKNTGDGEGKVKCDMAVLPVESKAFFEALSGPIESINPYLIQNRIVCKRENVSKKTKTDSEEWVPLLYNKLIRGETCCNGQLMELAQVLNQRNRQLAKQFPNYGCYSFQPYHKMVLGEGGGFYLNMQPLKLHPLYGLPYLPASSMKGALRGAWLLDCDTSREAQDPDFMALFGCAASDQDPAMGQMGELVFFDLFPERFTLMLDVETPHIKNYYDGKKGCGPTDDQNPVPILFVCLKDVKFQVLIACRDRKLWLRNQEKIEKMFHVVATQLGIGAKSSLGYGIVSEK